MSDINQFDIVFIVDVTGSMGAFIHTAKSMMVDMVKSLAANENVDMRIGVVQYSDHPPQDTVLLHVLQLTTADLAQSHIAKIHLYSGGDGPEAVVDGVEAACKQIKWRKHSRRVAVLIGDAPPHGVGAPGDGFAKGCPCGQTIESVSAMAEVAGVVLYSIALRADVHVKKSFTQLAQLTGGEFFTSDASGAVSKIQAILKEEFGNLRLDRLVLDAWNDDASVGSISEKLQEKASDVAASYMRLTRRGLIAVARPVDAEMAAV